MPEIKFPSRWLKANVNVKEGDTISFLSTGELRQDQWVFMVRINRTGEEKFFGLNKKNFNAISALYGTDSDKWVGKNMKVKIVTVDNPRGGEVEAVRLYDPAKTSADVPEESLVTAFDDSEDES